MTFLHCFCYINYIFFFSSVVDNATGDCKDTFSTNCNISNCTWERFSLSNISNCTGERFSLANISNILRVNNNTTISILPFTINKYNILSILKILKYPFYSLLMHIFIISHYQLTTCDICRLLM